MLSFIKIDIVTIFPTIASGPLGESMMKRAVEGGFAEIAIHDLREFTSDKHRQVDDEPYGGGPGMVMKPEPFFDAVESLKTDDSHVVMMTPGGKRFEQGVAREFAKTKSHLIILCGHYEGVDHRVTEELVDDELSIGDFVLTNGTIAAVVVVDAVVRLIPGVLGDENSPIEESFSEETGLLEAPQYTRPAEYRGMKIPDILLSGHHQKIAEWRHEQSLARTKANRPDLLD